MTKPQIIIDSDLGGVHNKDIKKTQDRLKKSQSYKDLSTIIVIPTRSHIHGRVVQCWMNLLMPMNQKVTKMFMIGLEIGEAYNLAVEQILAHPELSKWKYMMTLESDNMPPPDALLKLYEGIQEYDVVSGLYWTKGEGGMPMIYGNPHEIPLSFRPQMPLLDQLQEACGLGMGCNLFRLEMFKDKRLRKPWFKTVQEYKEGQGSQGWTQDLWFYSDARQYGYRFACDTRIKVGHYDENDDIIW